LLHFNACPERFWIKVRIPIPVIKEFSLLNIVGTKVLVKNISKAVFVGGTALA
jgi:hypothetical protein